MGNEDVLRNQQNTANNLNPRDTVQPVTKISSQIIRIREGPTVVNQISIGDAFTVGDSVNGIIGTANGRDGTQITIGTGKLGTETLKVVVNPNNKFVETFQRPDKSTSGSTTLLYSFEDTTATTADWDNTTDYRLEMAAGTTAQTLAIENNNETVRVAKVTLTGSTTNTLRGEINGGGGWETFSDGVQLTLANPTTTGTTLRLINDTGSGTAVIVNKIVVEYSTV